MPDTIKIEILENGIIKTTTDAVSMPNHANAEGFLRDIARMAGGKMERRHRHGATGHFHTHAHGEEHHEH